MRPPAARSWEPKPPLPPQRGTDKRREITSSSASDSKSDIGAVDEGDNCLLDVVVKTRRVLVRGMRVEARAVRSQTDHEDSIGKDIVGGRLRPEKDVMKTLT
jgi:hypothetical protein